MNGQPDHPLDETEQTEQTDMPETAEQQPDLASQLAEAQAKADENWNLYLRAVAEAENVRKRAARDVEHAHKYALGYCANSRCCGRHRPQHRECARQPLPAPTCRHIADAAGRQQMTARSHRCDPAT
jgi:hypothetical protein